MLPAKLIGTVSAYSGNGRKLGYPTANISSTTTLKDGVYFGFADLRQFVHHPALIFIGLPTTLGDKQRRVEAHLLDIADTDYYGDKLTLTLHYYHRPNQKFSGRRELQKAMAADEAASRQWFSSAK